MTFRKPLKPSIVVTAIVAMAAVSYFTRQVWLSLILPSKVAVSVESLGEAKTPAEKIIVSDKALENLGLADEARKAKPLKVGTFWKTITIPGMVVDRPGLSDRGV